MGQVIYRFFASLSHWIVYGNVYIALCAVVMCQTTARLFGTVLPDTFIGFVFAGTLGSYCLHWYLTESPPEAPNGPVQRLAWNEKHRQGLLVLFAGSALVGLWLMQSLRAYLPDLLPVLITTFLYSAPKMNWRPFRVLRRIAILKTAYLALVWTYLTAFIPLRIGTPVRELSGLLMMAWLLNRFLFIYSIAFWFDYRDRADDRRSKWLTIVSMLNDRQSYRFSTGLAVGFTVTIAGLYAEGIPGWPLVGLSVPLLIVTLTARSISRQSADYWYYVYLDGLLMVSGLLLLLLPECN